MLLYCNYYLFGDINKFFCYKLTFHKHNTINILHFFLHFFPTETKILPVYKYCQAATLSAGCKLYQFGTSLIVY